MTKIDDAKVKILKEIKAKEYVIGVEFDNSIGEHGYDEKPMGWRFFRLNIFHKNENGEATFSAKGVYIKITTGEFFLHPGGVPTKSLAAREIVETPIE